jgi:membrane protease YdiL (CAAX protease family)
MVALLAPLTVVVALRVVGSAWAVFGAYHLGICLALPLVAAARAGRSGAPGDAASMAGRLGLATRRGLGVGLLSGAALAVLLPLGALAMPQLVPDPGRLRAALAAWGIARDQAPLALAFLGVLGGPAEELLWRGWLHGRLVEGRRHPGVRAALLVAAFSSYHAVTLASLAPGPLVAAALVAGVAGAATLWTWLRIRHGTVWPALLSHAGASMGYVLVAAPRLG